MGFARTLALCLSLLSAPAVALTFDVGGNCPSPEAVKLATDSLVGARLRQRTLVLRVTPTIEGDSEVGLLDSAGHLLVSRRLSGRGKACDVLAHTIALLVQTWLAELPFRSDERGVEVAAARTAPGESRAVPSGDELSSTLPRVAEKPASSEKPSVGAAAAPGATGSSDGTKAESADGGGPGSTGSSAAATTGIADGGRITTTTSIAPVKIESTDRGTAIPGDEPVVPDAVQAQDVAGQGGAPATAWPYTLLIRAAALLPVGIDPVSIGLGPDLAVELALGKYLTLGVEGAWLTPLSAPTVSGGLVTLQRERFGAYAGATFWRGTTGWLTVAAGIEDQHLEADPTDAGTSSATQEDPAVTLRVLYARRLAWRLFAFAEVDGALPLLHYSFVVNGVSVVSLPSATVGVELGLGVHLF